MAKKRFRLSFFELLLLLVTIGVIVAVDVYIFRLNDRLEALEVTADKLSGDIKEVKTWAYPASMLEGKYASMNSRMKALTGAFNKLEDKLTLFIPVQQTASAGVARPADATVDTRPPGIDVEKPATEPVARPKVDEQVQVASVTAVAEAEALPVEKDTHTAPAVERVERTPAEAVDTARAATADTETTRKPGPWVINLLSETNRAAAQRFADRAHSRGIPVEQHQADVKGREFWRVQVTGFANVNEARAYAAIAKDKLGLEDVWIYNR